MSPYVLLPVSPLKQRRDFLVAELLAEAMRRWPGCSIDTNGLTEYGQPLWEALEARGYPICWPSDSYYDKPGDDVEDDQRAL